MKSILRIYIVAFLLCSIVDVRAEFKFGVNIDDMGAFVNIINHTSRYSNAIGYDSLGFPLSDFQLVLLDGRPVPEWIGVIDDPEQYRVDYSGIYKCSFIGQANVEASGTSVSVSNKIFDTDSNITYFDLTVGGYPNANHGLVFLRFFNTKRTVNSPNNSGLTNLKVNRPGYDISTQKIFTDEYIALCKAADFACYRFYNVQNIWGVEPVFPIRTFWQNRKTPNDASQSPMDGLNGKKDGWCWEYIIELANLLNKDIWINIHISCDSMYVAKLCTLLKKNLHQNINIYVENSNEVWSPTQETHGPYNKSEADYYGINFDQNYARRTVELSRWFDLGFGENEINRRIRVVLAGQHAYNGRSDTHLNYINNTFGEPRKFIYATSTALYFSSTNANSTNVMEINEGMMQDIESQINDNSSAVYRKIHIDKAKNWNLLGGCTSYEGGAHLPAGGGTGNLSNQILSHRTERMADAIKYNFLEGWKNLDGGLAMYFTLVSGFNRYGCWGLTDDYKKTDRNYKMQAARDIINSNTEVREDNSNIQGIFFFPNPASDYIEIKQPSEGSEIRIYNSFGELVIKDVKHLEDVGHLKIDISHLPVGLYFIQIGNYSEKFVVVR